MRLHCNHTAATPNGSRDETLLVGYLDDLSSHTDVHSVYHHFTKALSKACVGCGGRGVAIRPSQHRDCSLRLHSYVTPNRIHISPPRAPRAEWPRYSYLPHSSARLSSHQMGKTPCGSELPLTPDVDSSLLKAHQSLTGALRYCAVNTRPAVT